MTVVVDFEEEHHHSLVEEIQRRAFNRGDETRMTRMLRNSNGAISLVATVSGILFGHALLYRPGVVTKEVEFSPRLIAFGLISVDPDQQGRGIGRRLFEEAVFECRKDGYDGIVVGTLDPFWQEVGFEDAGEYNLHFENAPSSDPVGGIYWITTPKRADAPIYLGYPAPYNHGK